VNYTEAELNGLAAVAWAAAAELRAQHGDPVPLLPGDSGDADAHEVTLARVGAILGGATPEDLHEAWRRGREAQGWARGPRADSQRKTHPSLVPYADLPEAQRVRDRLLAAVVTAMAGGDGAQPVPVSPDLACACCAPDAADAKPAPELAALRSPVTGLIGMWDGMRKVHAPSDGEWEDWRAVLGRLVEELASQLDASEEGAREPRAARGFAEWMAGHGDALDDGSYTAADMAAAYAAGQEEPLTVKPSDDAKPAPGPAGCECGHAQTGHAFSDDVCAVPDCPCPGYRRTPRPAPELAAAVMSTPLYVELARQLAAANAAAREQAETIAFLEQSLLGMTTEATELRELLGEIGVMAANAVEDGDSFGLLEEIAMMIGAADVPDEPAEQPKPAPSPAADALFKVVEGHERVMYAATIDLIWGKPESALRMLDEQLDGWAGRPWNGAETGTQWLERTREGS
jgi:hypothetical protein